MQKTVADLLASHGITLMAPLSLTECHIIKPYLLERAGITNGTAFVFAVPYYTTNCDDPANNISAYAVSRDYHLFFKSLFDEIIPALHAAFPGNRFAGFTDHSPIAEADAACKAGIGFYGCNHLLLTHAHSSFVFLGEIITDAVLDAPSCPAQQCDLCGACKKLCPVELQSANCYSALTQKKGELCKEERDILLAHKMAWGCDICQNVCPVTARAKRAGTLYTTIPFFTDSALPHLSAELVRNMSDEEFATRAYSWRGRAVILRNLELLEKGVNA